MGSADMNFTERGGTAQARIAPVAAACGMAAVLIVGTSAAGPAFGCDRNDGCPPPEETGTVPGSDRIAPALGLHGAASLLNALRARLHPVPRPAQSPAPPPEPTLAGGRPLFDRWPATPSAEVQLAQGAALTDAKTGAMEPGGEPLWQAWTAGSYGSLRRRDPATAHNGHMWSGTAGVDRSFGKGLRFGLAVGHEALDLDTTFNGGGYQSNGVTVTGYGQAPLNDWLTLDGAVAWTRSDIDQSRTIDGAVNRADGETDQQRWLGAVNLTATQVFRWGYVGGRSGLVLAREEVDGFAESDGTAVPGRGFEFGQVRIGGQAGVFLGNAVVSLEAIYVNDFRRPGIASLPGEPAASDDRDGVELRADIALFPSPQLTAGITVSHEVFRRHANNTIITMIGSLRF